MTKHLGMIPLRDSNEATSFLKEMEASDICNVCRHQDDRRDLGWPEFTDPVVVRPSVKWLIPLVSIVLR
jgi:hypothetical protein